MNTTEELGVPVQDTESPTITTPTREIVPNTNTEPRETSVFDPHDRYPSLATYRVSGRDGSQLTFKGHLLGESSSKKPEHNHAAEHAPPHWKCSACRWFEIGIYRLNDVNFDKKYIIHTRGLSDVPDEIDYGRIELTSDPYEMMKLLTQFRVPRGSTSGKKVPVLPLVSQLALEKAGIVESEIDDALQDWLDAGA